MPRAPPRNGLRLTSCRKSLATAVLYAAETVPMTLCFVLPDRVRVACGPVRVTAGCSAIHARPVLVGRVVLHADESGDVQPNQGPDGCQAHFVPVFPHRI